MNKYIESDVKDGLKLLKIGLGNLIHSMIKENIKEYTLNIPININVIINLLKDFDDNIEFINSSNNSAVFYVDDRQIYINQLDNHCTFYNYPIFKC